MIIIGSAKGAQDLLEKRSTNYSDKMLGPMLEMYVLNLSNKSPCSSILQDWLVICDPCNGLRYELASFA